ncbi:hypothetical protein [Caenimonas sp. SL110]|uniref:hypothetical protein n=1 Tax=Caenimonas sp. SL110 TaxID=1450524 RepID=UPI0006547300|nr:hypothetical protein [Caenimonas sp. SL110]
MASTEPSPSGSTRPQLAWLAAALLCTVAPVAALVSWQAFDEAARERAALDASLARSAAALAQDVDAELAASLQALKVLSQSGFFQKDRVGSLGRLLHGRPRRDWDSLVVIDSDGSVILDTAPARIAAADMERVKALTQRMLASKAPRVTRAKGAVTLAVPVMQDGQLRYVLAARMAEATWVFLGAAAQRPDGARVQIFDASGDPILGPRAQSAAPAAAQYSASHEIETAGWKAEVTLDAGPVDERRRAQMLGRLAPVLISLLAGLGLGLAVGWRLVRQRGHAL